MIDYKTIRVGDRVVCHGCCMDSRVVSVSRHWVITVIDDQSYLNACPDENDRKYIIRISDIGKVYPQEDCDE